MNKPWTSDESEKLLVVTNSVVDRFGFTVRLATEKAPSPTHLNVDFDPLEPLTEEFLKPRTCGLIKFLKVIWGRPETIKAGPYNPWEEVEGDPLWGGAPPPRRRGARVDAPPMAPELQRPLQAGPQYVVHRGVANGGLGNPFAAQANPVVGQGGRNFAGWHQAPAGPQAAAQALYAIEPDPVIPADDEDAVVFEGALQRAEQEVREAARRGQPEPNLGNLADRYFVEAIEKKPKKPTPRFKYSFVRNDSGVLTVGIF
jgi:hypothetical protein